MKAPPRISHFLLAMLALAAFMFNSLPGMDACQTEAGHGAEEVYGEAHCLCAHGMEAAEVPLTMAFGLADCGTGCACIPARSQWRNQLPGRIQPEPRGRPLTTFGDAVDPARSLADLGRRRVAPERTGLSTPFLDPVLQSLRTVILLA